MNGFIIDHQSVGLIFIEFYPLRVEQRAQHSFTRCIYVSTGPNQAWHIDGYDKLKPFGFAIHGPIDGYSRKIVWLFVGSSNVSKIKQNKLFFYQRRINGCISVDLTVALKKKY